MFAAQLLFQLNTAVENFFLNVVNYNLDLIII